VDLPALLVLLPALVAWCPPCTLSGSSRALLDLTHPQDLTLCALDSLASLDGLDRLTLRLTSLSSLSHRVAPCLFAAVEERNINYYFS
jgi:hypothetical protein